eukprot:TRINITY_DN10149_c1_g1_i2.p1 TRINITY_DN10149_c1_g1~~TRINITY_DN10149_c1_g1_i2.p1  ORF type:complete len:216 (+),score=28.47 TRINITY_DN10149_c1_g1_i2:87-650(+)
MKIHVKVLSKWYPIEVLPSDTIWTLKLKIYEKKDVRKCHNGHWEAHPASPDDQKLVIKGEENALNDCERSLESYSIHEGSKLICQRRGSNHELLFHSLLDVYQKKQTKTTITSVSLGKHASIHAHEIRSIRLRFGNSLHIMKSLIHCVIHSMPSLKILDLSSSDFRFFPGCFDEQIITELVTKDGFE